MITPVDFDHEAFLGTQPGSHRRREGRDSEARTCRRSSRGSAPRPNACWKRAPRELRVPWRGPRQWRIDDLELDARGSRFLLSGELRASAAHPLPAGRRAPGGERRHRRGGAGPPGRSDAAIEDGHRGSRWPGRLERVSEHPEIILDGAHNPAGARALAAYIDRFYAGPARPPDLRRHARQGRRRDRRHSVSAGPPGDRHRAAAGARPVARSYAATGRPSRPRRPPPIAEALAMVGDAGPEDAIFITGSLFLVAEARDRIGPKP